METLIKINKNTSWFKKIPFIIGVAFAFFLPIFIIPTGLISLWASKNIFLFLGVTILFLIWAFERIKNKNFFISKNILVISAFLVPLSYLLSALFSGSIRGGLLGLSFEVNTFIMITALFLLMFSTSKAFKTKQQVLYLYSGLIFSAIGLALFHFSRLFLGPNFLSLGFLTSSNSNLIGNWNEVGIFFGLIAMLSLIINEYLGAKIMKIFSAILLIISLFFVWLINFSLVWISLAGLSLCLIIYDLFMNKREGKSKVDFKKLYKKPATYFFVVALIFTLFGQLDVILPSMFNISNLEVQPTIASTLSIAKSTLSTNPIVGAGPSKFSNQWLLYKSPEINMTQFWNTDFTTGSSFIISSLVTIGLLGFLSWILFILSVLYLGFKLLKISQKTELDRFVVLSLCMLSVYLMIFLIFYVPGIVTLGLTFLILGVLLSFLNQEGIVVITRISLKASRIKSYSLIIGVIILIGVNFYGMFLFTNKVSSVVKFNKALVAMNVDQDFNTAYSLIHGAITTYPNDFYYRNLTDLNLVQLQNTLSQKDISKKDLQTQFQAVFEATLRGAEQSVRLDPSNYLNWVNLAKVYGAATSLQIEGSYDKAFQAYTKAVQLNPKNPLLVLNLANLEITKGDLVKAKEYIGGAIQIKNNYSDAYYLLSQLALNQGDKEEASKVLEALASVSPNDPMVFLRLGAMNYDGENYKKAQTFLERAVSLNPYYSDAKYLLGLTYTTIGEREKAVAQFKDLKILNPNDKNIGIILENIQAGRNAFYGLNQNPQIQAESKPVKSEGPGDGGNSEE